MGKHKKGRSRSRSRKREVGKYEDKPERNRDRRYRSDSREGRGRDDSRDRKPRGRDEYRERRESRERSREKKKPKSRRYSDDSSMERDKPKKSKKTRRRRYSSSSDSVGTDTDSISSNDSAVLIAKLELKKMEEKKKLKQEKERRKALETPEEKRARRLMKKNVKGQKEREKLGWTSDMIQYDNDDNPFGDSNLTNTFRWEKKLEKEGISNINDEELESLSKTKIMEQRQELEKVKKARLERERERQERTELEELEQRSKESDKFAKWKADEDQFHLKQALLRSSIRISDGRAKPIDLLAKYISAEDEVDAVEMHEPYTYLNGLTTTDLEDLLEDIKVYQRLEKGANCDYWEDITVIVEDELHKLRKLDRRTGSVYEAAVERREGINKAVSTDVQQVFRGKTVDQLEQLQTSIEVKLKERSEGVDIGYWESLLSQLKAHTARGRLRDRHQENLKSKLAQLKAEQAEKQAEVEGIEGIDMEIVKSRSPSAAGSARGSRASSVVSDRGGTGSGSGSGAESQDEWEVELNNCLTDFRSGGYSPVYIEMSDLPPGTVTFLEEEDLSKRNFDQSKALQGTKVENVLNAEERALEKEARKGMGQDEATFSVESALEQSYEWSDKYRPRKPRYFNRVHTGFEWNKYNQTHYDFDNPPPKIVQGYKFNIFYPDLIEKSSTPQFKLIPTGDTGDFCILKIMAGPPYEDIAFKIVNKEWEYGYKRGFRCQFHNNIFQLWFHFKRYRYRR
eukprot:TRINITY_DN17717_c0_g1_i1.p1 TRINITY_DN17717_c0_g1~~TRINITY_DN17717_c0_g1_i1.p1  ORF type:complete len:739 (+),score=272.19 TRINITY_DN17717_c0_g1_i1:35-2251(+)